MVIEEPWYKKLEEKYGYDFCKLAGYFEEDRTWTDVYGHSYADTFKLPNDTTVIQFSGAFYPFHEGHLSIILRAIDEICDKTEFSSNGVVILHVDHKRYRTSKGKYNEEKFIKSFDLFTKSFPYKNFTGQIIFEDDMFLSCSRNFTRLYAELVNKRNKVYFLSGGDRANYALTFKDDGYCIISGRNSDEKFNVYKNTLSSDRIWFLDGEHPASSTEIRKQSQ